MKKALMKQLMVTSVASHANLKEILLLMKQSNRLLKKKGDS